MQATYCKRTLLKQGHWCWPYTKGKWLHFSDGSKDMTGTKEMGWQTVWQEKVPKRLRRITSIYCCCLKATARLRNQYANNDVSTQLMYSPITWNLWSGPTDHVSTQALHSDHPDWGVASSMGRSEQLVSIQSKKNEQQVGESSPATATEWERTHSVLEDSSGML